MHYRLIGVGNQYTYDLTGSSPVSVGRAVTNDLAVVDPTISRKHADLKATPGGVEVTDNGSSNGTFVNGVQIEHSLVVPGDEVTFGKVVFRLEKVAPVRPAAAAGAPKEGGGATIVRQIPRTSEALALGAQAKIGDSVPGADPADRDRRRLAILLEVSKGLTRSADINALLEKITEYAFQVLEADRCAILLTDGDGVLHPKISRDRRGEKASSDIPQSIARMAVDDKVAVLSDDAGGDQRFTGQSVVIQKVRSAMCVPLIGSENRVLGVLYVDNFSMKRFGENDLDFLIAFAGIAAVALVNGHYEHRRIPTYFN